MTVGAAIGSAIGAIIPLNMRKTIHDITKCVTLSNVKHLEFIIKSMPKNKLIL